MGSFEVAAFYFCHEKFIFMAMIYFCDNFFCEMYINKINLTPALRNAVNILCTDFVISQCRNWFKNVIMSVKIRT
jgi:hypothetical protein